MAADGIEDFVAQPVMIKVAANIVATRQLHISIFIFMLLFYLLELKTNIFENFDSRPLESATM